MKLNRNRIIRFALAAGLLLTTGCTKELESPAGAGYSDVQILATSELAPDNIVGELQSQTRAVADPTKTMTLHLVRADETGKGTDVYGAYSATPLTATRAAGTGVQPLTFATKQYYLADEVKSRFAGWWPAATSFTGGVASWTLDGSQDILTLAAQTGDYITLLPDLVFNHALSQLQFWVYAADAQTQADWGQITKLLVKAQPTVCKYDLATGAVTGDATSTADFAATNLITGSLPTVNTLMCNPVMIAPQAAPMVMKLYIETSTGMKVTVLLNQATYLSGEAYKINLKFVRNQVKVSVTVVPWNNVTSDDQIGKQQVGAVKDGGVVYWVDPTNPNIYKVVSVTEAPTTLKWAANADYVLGSLSNGVKDGKANTAAIKAAFDSGMAGAVITESTFDEAFPAVAWCYNYRGKDNADPVGTWYLPARNELQYLWCAYNGVAPISWETPDISPVDAPANPDAQAVFNKYLTDAGGDKITGGGFWTVSEVTTAAWYGVFSTGHTSYHSKINPHNIRCVKDKATNPILEIDANSILTVGGKMLFFQFGSVVGFTQEGAWAADKVLFNPVTGSPSYANYNSIPVYASADWDAGHKDISGANYHTGTNVKAGKGDPCKLVGLSAAQIQSMTSAQLDAYESGWLMPAVADNKSFSGQTGNTNYTAHWAASESRFDKWYYSTGSTGGCFPSTTNPQNYLPAAGHRDQQGLSSNVGVVGIYWSSEPASSIYGNYLYFNRSTIYPLTSYSYTYGEGVRCVKPSKLTVDANGILTIDGKMLFFKFGSVVGFTQEGDWAADKVLFNPVTGSPSYAGYSTIPVYTHIDYNANHRNVSDPAYHTGANIKAGKGDPCKLVGLSARQIQSMTTAQLEAYNSGWRLPTNADNQSFTGQTGNETYSAHWTTSDSRYDKWYYSTGSAGGYFPKGQELQKKNYLPAAGHRTGGGTNSQAGIRGDYWSSEPNSDVHGWCLYLGNANVFPIDSCSFPFGFGVRCVKI